MDMTTIAIPQKLKREVMELGNKGETYSDILARVLEAARQKMLYDILMSDENTITIDEAIAEHKRRWPE